MKTLKMGEEVNFEKVVYIVTGEENRFYLRNDCGMNSEILYLLKIKDRKALARKFGISEEKYADNGWSASTSAFPEFRTLEALTKFVEGLQRMVRLPNKGNRERIRINLS